MPGMSRPVAARPPEHQLVASPGRDIAVTVVALVLTATAFIAVADSGALAHIQRVDDSWLRLMVTHRSAPVTAVAKFFNLLGLVSVTLPVLIALAGYLDIEGSGRRQGHAWEEPGERLGPRLTTNCNDIAIALNQQTD